jgi:predicted HAD superfamily Cof-like phosphohydrolase
MIMKNTLKFFEVAKTNPTKRDFFAQFAVHIEEFLESIEALGFDGELNDALKGAIAELRRVVIEESDENIDKVYNKIDRVAALDSLVDQYVTLIGSARALGFDIESAVEEVEASNLSKFVYVGDDELDDYDFNQIEFEISEILRQGRYKGVRWKRVGEYIVFYDESGKILKAPSTYSPPNLEDFV